MQASEAFRKMLGTKLRDRRSPRSAAMKKRIYVWRGREQVSRHARNCLTIIACTSFVSILTCSNIALAAKNSECQSQISRISSKILAFGGKVAQVKRNDVDNSPFNDAASQVDFYLGQYIVDRRMGYSTEATKNQDLKNLALMHSSLVLKSYAALLIRECQDVVRVGFGYGEWQRYFSIHPNSAGDLKEDICTTTSPATSGLPWGEQYCL